MAQTRANPAEAYESYLVPALFAPWVDVLIDRAKPHAGDRVLDVACGTGIAARGVAPMVGETNQVVGIDISPDMLQVARARAQAEGLAIDWREASAVDLPFPEQLFDLVICQQGLQFFPDRPKAVREMSRVLSPEGRAVIATWRGLDFHPVYRSLSETFERHLGTPFPQPFSLGDQDELRGLLDGAGFRQVEIEEKSRVARFPEPERYLEMTVRGAAAVIPQPGELDEAERATRLAAIKHAMADVVAAHTVGDVIAIPWIAHVALARV
jgi:ubiquinone/menaquinone biosynthesis C-methylase UbiE